MKISDTVKGKIKESNKLTARLMITFNRGQRALENWIKHDDVRLTTPAAVQIIKEETGLTEEQILEPVTDGITNIR